MAFSCFLMGLVSVKMMMMPKKMMTTMMKKKMKPLVPPAGPDRPRHSLYSLPLALYCLQMAETV